MVDPSGAQPFSCFAVDLGASSGRVVFGVYDGWRIEFEEVHRFPNGPTEDSGTLYWDFEGLMAAVVEGLRKGVERARHVGLIPRSVGIDSWGVDFGLLDEAGHLISPPVHYRDLRTEGILDYVVKSLVSREEIYRKTGIQFLPFNTLYQLVAYRRRSPGELERARTLLLIADLVQYFLTGQVACEYTNATTTQLVDAVSGDWSWELIDKLNLPRGIFPRIVQPGTSLGRVRTTIGDRIVWRDLEVVAVATHDTGSAVAAVPARSERFAYLSCGTWSLLGTEISQPLISEESLEFGITNEGGVENTFRLLRNIMGLWLLQESRSEWNRQGRDYTWDRLTELAEGAEPFRSFVDPDDPRFLPPGDMPERIRDYCRDSGQPVPDSDASVVRCILESLALKYSQVLTGLERLTNESLPALHLVGGGARNRLLCQFTADACEHEVIAGPVEATAFGNIGVQLLAAGKLSGLESLRRAVESSETLHCYRPGPPGHWGNARQKFEHLTNRRISG